MLSHYKNPSILFPASLNAPCDLYRTHSAKRGSMSEGSETDGISITEAAKQAGAEAFSRATGNSTFDALKDEALCAEMMALWDCESVGDLQAQAVAGDPPPGFVLKAARAAYVGAVLAALGVRQAKRKGQGR